MKLYDFPLAPNPLRVNLFVAEKGLEIERVIVDLSKQEQLKPEYVAKNPVADVPMLELDDGTCISQISGIVRYLEAAYPEPRLLGTTPKEQGLVAMWENIAFLHGIIPAALAYRHSNQFFADRAELGRKNYGQIPEMAARGRDRIGDFLELAEEQLGKSPYLAGDHFSMADITLYAVIYFINWMKIQPGEQHPHLMEWHQRVSSRPSIRQMNERK